MPAKPPYDLAVIGAGPGGYVAAIRAAQLGFKVICIEKRDTLGGTCLNVGCIPSKALLQSSQVYALLGHEAAVHGITCDNVHLDFDKMMQRKDKVVKTLVGGVATLLKKNGVTWGVGEAKITSPQTIELTHQGKKQLIEAKNILLATGSDSIALPFLPFDEKRVVSSTGALALTQVPKRMLVVGAGVIGVELASVYRRLGSEVVIVEMLDRVCPAMDSAVSKALLQILKKQGLDIHLGVKVTGGKVGKNEVALTVAEEGKERTFAADVVLVAIGRRPFSQGLGLAEIGVKADPKGFVEVDGNFRTSVPNIYAIGDLIPGIMLAHRASEEGMAVAELLKGLKPKVRYLAIPNVIYTHPEVAAVGLTEAEASEGGRQVKVGSFPMRINGRALCAGDEEGFVKVVGDAATGRLLGMHIIAANASEMIGEGVMAMERNATLEDIANAPHAHPTLSEAIKEAALQALGRPVHI